jgi:ABC-type amino acid transport system permease subunit
MAQLPPDLALRALSLLLITLLGVVLVVFTLISMWKENRLGWPLRGIVRFYLAIIGSCAVIALLTGYVQKARSIKSVTHRVEAVTLD